MPRREHRHTFSVDTRSAVSNRVNWLIWSTMPEILGLTLPAAASVDWNRHRADDEVADIAEIRHPIRPVWMAARAEPTHWRAASEKGAAIAKKKEEKQKKRKCTELRGDIRGKGVGDVTFHHADSNFFLLKG